MTQLIFFHKTWFRWLVKSASKRCKDFHRLTCMTEHKYEILSSALENWSYGKLQFWEWKSPLLVPEHFVHRGFSISRTAIFQRKASFWSAFVTVYCRSRQIVPTIMHSGHNFDFIDYIGMFKDYAVVKKITLVSAKM